MCQSTPNKASQRTQKSFAFSVRCFWRYINQKGLKLNVKNIITSIVVILLTGCASSGQVFTKKIDANFFEGVQDAGIKSYISKEGGGYDCCRTIYKEIKNVDKKRPYLTLTQIKDGMILTPNSAKDLIPYLSILYDFEGGNSEQRTIHGRKVFSRYYEGEQRTYFWSFRYYEEIVIKNEDLPKLITILQDFLNQFEVQASVN
jgi:hypothetical protein